MQHHYNVVAALATIFVAIPNVIGCLIVTSAQGYKLYNQAFASHRDSNVLACFDRCQSNPVCQSINYWLGNSVCELNNRTREVKASLFRPMENWVYFENPNRAIIGSESHLAALSCKEIRDNARNHVTLPDGEYWVDPDATGNPFTVFCDMTTDGGGWMLIAQTVLKNASDATSGMARVHDYHQITNYTNNGLRIDLPSIALLRRLTGFTQLRYYCSKRSTGRTVHIMTKGSPLGQEVVNYFTIDNLTQPLACGSYDRLPDDNSIVASNCTKWGECGINNWPGKWGYFVHDGGFRIYNDPMYWNGTLRDYYVNMLPGSLYCDESKKSSISFSAGDTWKVLVR